MSRRTEGRGRSALCAALALVVALGGSACVSLVSLDSLDSLTGRAEPALEWPPAIVDVRIVSSVDGSLQPALFYRPPFDGPEEIGEPRPLLVALHAWSANYRGARLAGAGAAAIERGWVFVHPDFRGPNDRPEALGSAMAVQDVLDAVAWARASAPVDASRIYLLGFSGGGHAALLAAARAPDLWAGVSVWVPISDLVAWHAFQSRFPGSHYRAMLESAIGDPSRDAAALAEAVERSPATHLEQARGLPLDIHVGVRDGHDGPVPISQSLRAFNVVARPDDRLSTGEIQGFTESGRVPASLQGEVGRADPGYGRRAILFRRRSGVARITVFDGGHEILLEPALRWLSVQSRPRPEPQPEPRPDWGRVGAHEGTLPAAPP
ncbi:MAG: prolyl oligopeptidase family serine peptidase [Proteobacteria bacterium]|nr:prolyl oligopeptidase family serine peptidase [Pseudomonadota bacterium]